MKTHLNYEYAWWYESIYFTNNPNEIPSKGLGFSIKLAELEISGIGAAIDCDSFEIYELNIYINKKELSIQLLKNEYFNDFIYNIIEMVIGKEEGKNITGFEDCDINH